MAFRGISFLALSGLLFLAAVPASTQSFGTVRGTISTVDNVPITGAQVTLKGSSNTATTNRDGRFVMTRVPTGPQTFNVISFGYSPASIDLTVAEESSFTLQMKSTPLRLGDISVVAASREPEKIVEAPAAVTVVEPRVLQNIAATGQAPIALAQSPGVDLVQSGVNDFNINARGFNSSLNRRVLTMLDGRDLAIAFLGSQEWNSLPVSTDGFKSMELVRGPGSALYGANAFAGVINMTTYSPREAPGGKVSLAGGELSSFRLDGSYATTLNDGAWGFRLNAGYSTNDTWSRSRTSADGLDLRREYADAVKGINDFTVPAEGPEAIPLNGQGLAAGTRSATGDRKPITTRYGTARLDNYTLGDGVLTVEGGASKVENEVLITGIGRIQVIDGVKPFARAAYTADHFTVFGWWNNRDSKKPQYSLASGAPLIEKSNIFHLEGQANTSFADGKGKFIAGASERVTQVNTEETLMRAADDDRSDKLHSAYAQLEYRISERFRVIGAGRYDQGDLFEGRFSPKGAVVFSPNENHSIRASVNSAFQTPNYSEFFLQAHAAAPINLTNLEAGLRASALGAALAGVPNGTLFSKSSTVAVIAHGNADLKVEQSLGYEVGYKGNLNDRTWITVDAYFNNITDFVTDLLPGINPNFPYWTAPDAVPAPYREALINAVRSNLATASATAAAGLTRDEDGKTVVMISYGNAGDVDQKGIDVGAGYQINDNFRVDGSISFFSFKVNSQQAGDKLLPNTPRRKGVINLSYEGLANGFDASLSLRMVPSYDWAAGVFEGPIPASETLNASAGYQINNRYRVSLTGTNILNQQRYSMYGGSIIGRRILAGVSAEF